MKNIFKHIAIFTIAVFTLGCEGFIEGFEKDPNNPSGESVDVNNMIQGVMLGDALLHEGEMARLAGLWSNHFSGVDRQYINLDQYIVTAGDFDSPWSTIYYATITQARLAQVKAENELNPKVKGVAQVLEAHAAGTATALFGDVPFSEVTIEDSPKFDSQEEVYASIQILLDQAIENLELNRGILNAATDIYYGGDAQKWIRLAYTLKARYYLHVGNYAAAEAAALQGIASPEGDMVTPHMDSYYNVNVFYSFGQLERQGYMTAENAYAPLLLDPSQRTAAANNRNNAKTDESARFAYYYTGTPGTYDLNYDGAFAFDAGYPMVTYAETQLIIAEARARMDNLAGAIEALNARRAALNAQFGTATNPTPYLPLTLVDFAVAALENPNSASVNNALINEILEERYVTFTGNIEAFNDIRRTDNLLMIPSKGTSGKIPERFLYPQSEINANPNVPSPLPGLYDPTSVNN